MLIRDLARATESGLPAKYRNRLSAIRIARKTLTRIGRVPEPYAAQNKTMECYKTLRSLCFQSQKNSFKTKI
jgi:hypothetical protein